KKLNEENIEISEYDFLISFGYRYKIGKEILDYFKEKAINLHISYLPWNKGADPNLWSFLEDTPKGVTIHQMDYNFDTGQILCRKEVSFDDNDTLRYSYEKLHTELVELFLSNWENIKFNKVKPKRQTGTGTYHKSSDKNRFIEKLTDGWDTQIKDIKGKAGNA
ncbi:MAG: formyltransferase family protein, partial [Verrucomicrobiota bacterium]|nr:formyltransferase family protein [Verrucomicrobiota bacterium]